MMRAGQCVICVHLTQPVNRAFPPVETILKLRGVYRIAKVYSSRIGQRLEIEGIAPWVWEAHRFKPIEPADSNFVTLLRRWPSGIPSWTVRAPGRVGAAV